MKIIFHKNFDKQYVKLKDSEKEKVKDKLALFLEDLFNPLLCNHVLKGKYLDYRSINISGGLRAIYKRLSEDDCIFVAIGRHSSLYS